MRPVVLAAVAASLALAPTTAAAQAPGLTPLAPAPEPVITELVPQKQESTATMLAIGGTLAGWGLMYLAADTDSSSLAYPGLALALVGPSAGHIYAGEGGHAVKTSLLRTGGGLLFLVGLISQFTAGDCFDCSDLDDDRETGKKLMWLGGALYVGTTLYDIADAGGAVRRANEKRARSFLIAPSLVHAGSGAPAPAVSVIGRF